MKKSKNRILLLCFLLVSLGLSSVLFITSKIYNSYSNQKLKIDYNNGLSIIEQLPGTYTSTDGKTITVAEDGTTKYLDTYTLTVTESATGNVISGKVGTNNKAATFYQLNNHMIVSSDVISYTHNGVTEYLYDYTIFALDSVTTIDSNGIFELYSSDEKKASYATLQDAVDSANSGDIIKISKNSVISEGAYIDKNITIEGNNHTLDKSKWFNPVFVIEEGITANINNLTIDGGENTFEIDFSTETPSIKENTLNNEVKSKTHIIISRGIINTNHVNIQNIYTVQEGTAIRILRGKASIKNGSFNHNHGNELAVVIRTGSSLKSSDTELPVEELIVDNCEFKNNYVPGGSGGAILLNNVTTTKIKNSTFHRNIVTTSSSGGGAIYYDSTGQSNTTKLNIDYPKVYVENSIFEENYSGNDGFAISNDSAHLYIDKTNFIGNVGLHDTSSVGTVSCMNNGSNEYDVKITNSTFTNNKGPVNGFGDHGTLAKVEMDNVIFDGNEGNISVLIYQANSTLNNLTFKNSISAVGLIDIRTHYNVATNPLYPPNIVTLKDITFENNNTPAEIFIRKNSHNTSANMATVNLEGVIKGNVDIIDGQKLNIKGTLEGNIYSDDTLMENIIVESSENKSTYNLFRYNNHSIVTVHYPMDKDTQSIEYLYLEKNKTHTEKDIYQLLHNDNEGYTMKLYTDSSYTSPWNYTPTDNITIYGRWEEHTHEFNGTYVKENNIIREECVAGHIVNKLELVSPTENTYSGKEIPITVNNSLNAKDYKILYYVKDNDDWKEINSVPIEVGTYKAILNFNNLEISKEYSILEPPKVEEPEKEEPKEEDKKEESKEDEKTEELPPVVEEEKDDTPKEEPKDENNPFTSSSSLQFVVMILGIIAFVIFIIAQKKIKLTKF